MWKVYRRGKRLPELSSKLKWKGNAYSLSTYPGEEVLQNIPESEDTHQEETASWTQHALWFRE